MGKAQKKRLQAEHTTNAILSEIGNSTQAYPTKGRPNPRVSSTSCWQDRRWFLNNPTPGTSPYQSMIEWDLLFEDGTNLLDPCHADLLEQFRRLAWSLFAAAQTGKALKPGSAHHLSVGLRELLQWMVKNSYSRISELDSTASQRYLDDLQARLDGVAQENSLEDLLDENELAAIETADREGNEEPSQETDEALQVTDGWVQTRLVVWRYMWDQREAMHAAGVAPLSQQPFGGRKVFSLAKEMGTKSVQKIPPLPDEVAVAIMNAAHAYVETAAPDVLRMVEGMLALRNTYKRSSTISTHMKKWEFSAAQRSDQPWHSPLAEVESSPPTTLRLLADDLSRACAIILQSETGMRANELCSLPAGINPETGLPACIEIRLSKSGMLDLFYLKGTLSKTRPTPESATWLLAARPRGSDVLPNSVRTVDVIQKLLQPFRGTANGKVREALFVIFDIGDGFPTDGQRITALTSAILLKWQKRFVVAHVDWATVKATPDTQKYINSKGDCLRTHQWRKTYAQFVFQVNPKLLPAIARQFKHLSIAMTEGAYINTNDALLNDVAEHNLYRTTDRLLEFARGTAPKMEGRLARLLEKYQGELGSIIKGKNDTEARQAMLAWCSQRGLKLFFHGYGGCIPGLAPTEAECHKRAQTVHWANTAPNYATREPNVCTGCFLFMVGPESLEFWGDRYVSNSAAYLQAKAQGKADDFRVAKERAAQSASYLKFLDVPLPEIVLEGESHAG
jgi:integrase